MSVDGPQAGGDFEVFLAVDQMPVHVGAIWPTAEAARECARGDIRLAFDRRSGRIANVAFDPTRVDYTLRYDNALHFSPFFQAYERDLAHRLVERYDVRHKEVIEIGAGGGHFIGLLCEIGDNRGTGYDPSHDAERADARVGDRVEVVRDFYSERYADRPADLVCCRHVLEHIQDPEAFLRSVRRTLEGHPDSVVYFEVPNSYLILDQLSVWDIVYEHCGYFVPESLAALFASCGFEVLDVYEAYEGQFCAVEARPTAATHPTVLGDAQRLATAVSRFPERFSGRREGWQQRLAGLRAAKRKAVVWGGGAKAVSFLNLLEIGDLIEYIVDINPGKQGSFLAGTGQPIVAPEFLREYRPDLAIVMNPVYTAEIEQQLASLGLQTETMPV